ncbi:MAG: hypothetical protein RIK87_07300 [Fuerstiella sp.]
MSPAAEFQVSGPRRIAAGLQRRVRSLNMAATGVLIVVTVLTLAARQWWLADLLANLRVQWLVSLTVVAFVAVCQRRWKLLLAQCVVAAVHVPWLLAAWQAAPLSSARTPSVTVTTANVYTSNHRFTDIEHELLHHGADVVAVLELSTSLRDHLAGPFSEYRFPAFPFGLVLDHILSTDGLRAVSCNVGHDVGSDHRFVTVGFDMPDVGH